MLLLQMERVIQLIGLLHGSGALPLPAAAMAHACHQAPWALTTEDELRAWNCKKWGKLKLEDIFHYI